MKWTNKEKEYLRKNYSLCGSIDKLFKKQIGNLEKQKKTN